ncbi:MAG: hypothetical protein K8S25_17280 [Alphaproteobacteria bacterium]|nr:hypothetical protein [Alphaproteobacteria bacterium]
MNRTVTAAGLLFAVLSLAACSSLNPFSKPKERQYNGPLSAAETAAEAAKPKRVREAEALKRFSTNGDLTKPVLEVGLKADYAKSDLNADGVLDTAETRALNEQLRSERNMSPVFDWNADGRIDYTEFATQWRTLFDRADRNRDGIVDADEIEGSGRDRTPRPLPEPTFSGKDGRPPGSP